MSFIFATKCREEIHNYQIAVPKARDEYLLSTCYNLDTVTIFWEGSLHHSIIHRERERGREVSKKIIQ